MAIGTTAMVLGGIAAGGQVFGGVMQSRAAGKAAKAQQQAAQKAAPIMQQVYREQMAGMDPYAALGRQSANTLGRLMQPGVPYNPQMQAMDAMAFQQAGRPWADPMSNQAVPRGAPPSSFAPFAGMGGFQQPMLMHAPGMQPGSTLGGLMRR